jgi:F0F1-type ATP synthase beta subunit
MSGIFTNEDRARFDGHLAATDELLNRVYPGDDGSRQPVHTVYVPADRFAIDLAEQWGAQALAAVDEAGGMEALAARVGIDPALVECVAATSKTWMP